MRAREPGTAAAPRIPTEARRDEATFDAELADLRRSTTEPSVDDIDEDELAPEPAAWSEPPAPSRHRGAPVHGRVHVLSGPSAGRVVDISRETFVIGRVGLQVAAIEVRDETLWLVPREGESPPTLNGAPVEAGGREMQTGDTFEIAGTRLELTPGR
jgi:hypothetical protein